MDQNKKKAALQKELSRIKRDEEERRAKARAGQLKLPYVNLSLVPIDTHSLSVLPKKEAEQGRLLLLSRRRSELEIAVEDPDRSQAKKTIKRLRDLGFRCQIHLASRTSMDIGLEQYQTIIEPRAVLRDILKIQQKELDEFEKSLATIQQLQKTINEFSTTKLLTVVVAGALKMKASDIHVEPEKDGIRLRYRIDGLLHDITSFPTKEYRFFLSRIKSLSAMFLNVTDTSQDGRFTIQIVKDKKQVQATDVRVSVLPTAQGESVVMRLLTSSDISFNLEDLGIRPAMFRILANQISRPNGMILTTGPTGSGKTTTLYACINSVNEPGKKIITVEDPVEYKLKSVIQTQVSHRQTFAKAIKAVVRQDPDVLMVGEIRDHESAGVAIQFALTGHLVFSTLHTNDAAGAIPRLTDLGVKDTSLTLALNLIIAQRLVRKLCPHCKEVHQLPAPTAAKVKKILSSISARAGVAAPKTTKFYRSKGCIKCHGIGYTGRIGVYEFLTVSNNIAKMIVKRNTVHEIRATAIQEGMLTLMQDALVKAANSITSLKEVERVVGPLT